MEFAGFIAANVATYGLGIGALKLARMGVMGGPVSRAMGIIPNANRSAVRKAVEAMAQPGGAMADQMRKSTVQRLLLATGDNVMMAAAGETMTLLLLQDSPFLKDYSAKDFAINVVGFGGLSGLMDWHIGSGIIKNAAMLVDKEMRAADAVFNPALYNLRKQNEISVLAESLTKLTDELPPVKFDYSYGGQKVSTGDATNPLNMDITARAKQSRQEALKTGKGQLAIMMNDLAAGNTNIGQGMFDLVDNLLTNGLTTPLQRAQTRDTIIGMMTPIAKLGSNKMFGEVVANEDALYIARKGIPDADGGLLSQKFMGKDTHMEKPIRLFDGVKKEDVVFGTFSEYGTKEDAFSAGVDIYYAKNGNAVVNRNSARVARTESEITSNTRIIDLESGTWNFEPVLTAADDIVDAGKDVRMFNGGVSIAGKPYVQGKSGPLSTSATAVDSNARWIWAAHLTDKDLLKLGQINTQDLALLSRIEELWDSPLFANLELVDDLGNVFRKADIPDGEVKKFVTQQRLAWLAKRMEEMGPGNTTEIAVHLNVSRQWVEKAIEGNFKYSKELETMGALSTKQSMRPRTVAVLVDEQQQLFRGTDPKTGKPIEGPLVGFIQSQDFDAEGLAKNVFGITISKKSNFSDVTDSAVMSVLQSSPGSAHGVMVSNSVGGKAFPRGVHVNSPVAKRITDLTGLNWRQIVSHELGHAMDFFLNSLTAQRTALWDSIEGSSAANRALQQEMRATSASFRPVQWSSQPDYVRRGVELMADNFATWMTKPEMRSQMPLFAEMFGKQLGQYESYFKQRVWGRLNGPMLADDAKLAHEYELTLQMQRADTAVAQIHGSAASDLPDPRGYTVQTADSTGTGSTTWGAADANYGDKLRSLVGYLGRWVDTQERKRVDEVVQLMKGPGEQLAANPTAAAEVAMIQTRLRRDAQTEWHLIRQRGKDGQVTTYIVSADTKALMDIGEDVTSAINKVEAKGQPAFMKTPSQAAADFLGAFMDANNKVRGEKSVMMSAVGVKMHHNPTRLYAPALDTARYKHVAIVRSKERIGGINDITMLVAKDAAGLRKEAAKVPDDYEVLFKDDTEAFFKAKGTYDYNHVISDSRVNSALKRAGVLSDFFPEVRPENVIEDSIRFLANQNTGLVKHSVELKYGQLFSELKFLSGQYSKAEESVAQGMLAIKAKKIQDPFGDYVKTALNISKQGEFPLLDSLNEFVDKVGKQAYEAYYSAFRDPAGGMTDWQTANKVAKSYGLPASFSGIEEFLAANERIPRNMVSEISAKANKVLATFGLRLDAVNSLVNVLSTPIMLGMEVASIRKLAAGDPATAGILKDMMTVVDPQSGKRLPSTTAMIAKAFGEYAQDLKSGELMRKYQDIAGMNQFLETTRSVMDDLAYKEWQTGSAWLKKIDGWADKASIYTGNIWSEQFTRFVSANIMDQMTRPLVAAGKISEQEARTYITTFVNRVQGNYLASQRPALFQGTAGRTISLFQTYSFNVFQQLFRHVQDRNARALMTFGALQASVYGLNGLPYFDAINTHLIGSWSHNPEHKDAYSELPKLGDAGKWLLYGTPSAFPLFDGKGPALYTRGDLSPRTLIGLPTSPSEIPAISAATKVVGAITTMASQLGQGADFEDAMFRALEHQGISRPLAGFAQTVQGRATTTKGNLISASADMNELTSLGWLQSRMVDFGGAMRVLGAKPLDDAIMMDAVYKNNEYRMQDRERIEALGSTVKQKLYNNQLPETEELQDFMASYVARGGTHQQFAQSMQRWSRDANVSVVNQMANKLRDPYSQRLQVMMGGEDRPDYWNQGNTGAIDFGDSE